MATTQSPTATPTSVSTSTSTTAPTVNTIIAALLSSAEATHDVLAKLGAQLASTPEFLDDQRLLRTMSALVQLVEHRARVIAAEATINAIATLTKVIAQDIQSPRHAETIRKACGSIIRLNDALHKRARESCPGSPPSSATSSAQAKTPAQQTSESTCDPRTQSNLPAACGSAAAMGPQTPISGTSGVCVTPGQAPLPLRSRPRFENAGAAATSACPSR